MQIRIHETMQLGDLIAAAFDEAARHSSDSREVARLATRAVARMLRGARKVWVLPPAPLALFDSRGVRGDN